MVERVRLRVASRRAIDTAALVNWRPDVTCPVSGVLALDTNGNAIAFFVSLTLSRNSMVASRPTPSKPKVPPLTCFRADDIMLCAYRQPDARLAANHAALLVATQRLKFIDALHVATALNVGCTVLITNDVGIRPVEGLNVIQLAALRP